MAYKEILKINNGLGKELITFLADTIADIENIPTTVVIGSTINCLENKKKYVLSTTRDWTEQ